MEERREPYGLPEDLFPFSLCRKEKVFEFGCGGEVEEDVGCKVTGSMLQDNLCQLQHLCCA